MTTIVISYNKYMNGQDSDVEEIIRGHHIALKDIKDNWPLLEIYDDADNLIAIYKRFDSIKFRDNIEEE